MPAAPDDVMASIIIGEAAARPTSSRRSIAGQPIVILSITYAGPADDADRVLAPLLSLGEPASGFAGPPDLPRLPARQRRVDGLGPPDLHQERVRQRAPRRAHRRASSTTSRRRRRARTCSRSGPSAAPWAGSPTTPRRSPGRSAPFWIGAESMWDDPADDEAHRRWGRSGIELMRPWQATGSYVNDVTELADECDRPKHLRGRQVRAPGGAQAGLGSRQRVPPEPERPPW